MKTLFYVVSLKVIPQFPRCSSYFNFTFFLLVQFCTKVSCEDKFTSYMYKPQVKLGEGASLKNRCTYIDCLPVYRSMRPF